MEVHLFSSIVSFTDEFAANNKLIKVLGLMSLRAQACIQYTLKDPQLSLCQTISIS